MRESHVGDVVEVCRFIYDSVITVRNMKNMQNMK